LYKGKDDNIDGTYLLRGKTCMSFEKGVIRYTPCCTEIACPDTGGYHGIRGPAKVRAAFEMVV